MPATAEKICTTCNSDLAGKKRFKNSTGDYYCPPCWTDRSARKAKRVTAPVEALDGEIDLGPVIEPVRTTTAPEAQVLELAEDIDLAPEIEPAKKKAAVPSKTPSTPRPKGMATCEMCQRHVPPQDLGFSPAGDMACPDCLANAQNSAAPACSKCGNTLPGEGGLKGDGLCKSCRADAQPKPATLQRGLTRQSSSSYEDRGDPSLSGLDKTICILLPGIGLLIGLVRMIRKNPSGSTMFWMAITMNCVWGAIGAILKFALGGMQ